MVLIALGVTRSVAHVLIRGHVAVRSVFVIVRLIVVPLALRRWRCRFWRVFGGSFDDASRSTTRLWLW
jgi:hypothetical protein